MESCPFFNTRGQGPCVADKMTWSLSFSYSGTSHWPTSHGLSKAPKWGGGGQRPHASQKLALLWKTVLFLRKLCTFFSTYKPSYMQNCVLYSSGGTAATTAVSLSQCRTDPLCPTCSHSMTASQATPSFRNLTWLNIPIPIAEELSLDGRRADFSNHIRASLFNKWLWKKSNFCQIHHAGSIYWAAIQRRVPYWHGS